MKFVYILLTRSQTMLSRAIHACTKDTYTHASIAFDSRLESLASFARRYAVAPLPAGLVRERLEGGYFDNNRYIPCALYALPVPDEAWQRLKENMEAMMSRHRAYRYSLRGLFLCKRGVPERREDKFFCSQFVGMLLEESGCCRLNKPPELTRPQDLENLPGAVCIYRGRLSGLTHDTARLTRRAEGCFFVMSSKNA